jgi:vacuolar-type H+-ATPase subunit I/STV1
LAFAEASERESAERAAAREAARIRAEEEAEKRRIRAEEENRVVEVEIEQPEGFVVDRILTKEERINAIQQLVATIPSEKEELFLWEIKWKELDDVLYLFNLDHSSS